MIQSYASHELLRCNVTRQEVLYVHMGDEGCLTAEAATAFAVVHASRGVDEVLWVKGHDLLGEVGPQRSVHHR